MGVVRAWSGACVRAFSSRSCLGSAMPTQLQKAGIVGAIFLQSVLLVRSGSLLRVPWRRRVQTFAVVVQQFTQSGVSASILALLILRLFGARVLAALGAAYYAVILNDGCEFKSGRKSNWFRNWSIWKQLANYFPAKLVKTAALDPSKGPYIFGYHPHGIFVVGAITNFATNGGGFDELFPGIDLSLAIVNPIFKLPLAREFALSGSCVSANKDTILYNLNAGRSMLIAPGGANEALRTSPGTLDILLEGRQGFVKMAVMTGASLVPVISFGENETFSQYKGGLARKVQKFFMDLMGFSIPLFHGRGVFNYSFGLFPHRVPIRSVVRSPIPCPKMDPTADEFNNVVSDLHQRYMRELQDLYDKHADDYYLREAAEWFAPRPPVHKLQKLRFVNSRL